MDGKALWMGCRWKSPERDHQNNGLDALRATWQAGTIEERCCRVVRQPRSTFHSSRSRATPSGIPPMAMTSRGAIAITCMTNLEPEPLNEVLDYLEGSFVFFFGH
jgi:hypothetical protein